MFSARIRVEMDGKRMEGIYVALYVCNCVAASIYIYIYMYGVYFTELIYVCNVHSCVRA